MPSWFLLKKQALKELRKTMNRSKNTGTSTKTEQTLNYRKDGSKPEKNTWTKYRREGRGENESSWNRQPKLGKQWQEGKLERDKTEIWSTINIKELLISPWTQPTHAYIQYSNSSQLRYTLQMKLTKWTSLTEQHNEKTIFEYRITESITSKDRTIAHPHTQLRIAFF